MGATIIKADKKSNKLLSELAKKLGGDVIKLQDDQFEDLVLGSAMTAVKTGEIVDRASIMSTLKTI
ncbi:MAG: hypothetical protein GX103_01920 [Bacteroidales bacterium]|nr:hypothetical protein [Bacteroidales bacterium]